jgi:hypothetical protein
MNFYVLPRANNQINIMPTMSCAYVVPFLNASYYNILLTILDQIKNSPVDHEMIISLMNPFLSVSQVTHHKQKVPICKHSFRNPIMYSFVEILNNVKFFSRFSFVGEFAEDFNKFTLHRNERHNTIYDQSIVCYEIKKDQFQNYSSYVASCIEVLEYIVKEIKPGNGIVFNLDHLFLKSVVDFVFVLTSLFGKVAFVKPTISNPTSFEKFLVCQDFLHINREKLVEQLESFKTVVRLSTDLYATSLITNPLPAFFLNKMEDVNVIYGQQQLETLNQVINIANNKAREEKIENMQRQSIQKSVQWCEKNDLPCHRFVDRSNLFREEIAEETV